MILVAVQSAPRPLTRFLRASREPMQSIIRVEHSKERPYLTVSTETVRDHEVSFEARGFLMFLLAKSDDWRVRPEQLATECGLHRSTIYRMLDVLIKAGYIQRETIVRHRADGTFDSGSLYTVYEDKRRGNLDRTPF
jgi:hypothetical protein